MAATSCATGAACHGAHNCADRHCPGRGTERLSDSDERGLHQAALTLLTVLFVVGWLGLAAYFDAERESGDAQHGAQAAVAQRRAIAALKICGPGAAPIWIDETTLQCRQHNGQGRATLTAGVAL